MLVSISPLRRSARSPHTSRPTRPARRPALLAGWPVLLLVLGLGAVAPPVHAEGLEITDERITLAIEVDLETDPGVAAHRVDVTTEGGIVTLSGAVDHLLARHRAVTVAESIRGVRSVIDRVRVEVPARLDDVALADLLRTALSVNPYLERAGIQVRVVGGQAILEGSVRNRFELNEAERVAASLRGVIEVENRLQLMVGPQPRSDWELAAEIADALAWDALLGDDEIVVAVDDGVATLQGTVDSWRQVEWAARRARDFGARRVVNLMAVRFSSRPAPPSDAGSR